MRDIENVDDIKTFVDEFYSKIKTDDLLSPVFALRIAPDDWGKHLNRMYDFWNTVLFFKRSYKGNPFSKHAHLPIRALHFERWLQLFKETIDDHFRGEQAESTKMRVEKMAVMFMTKKEHLNQNPDYRSIV